MAHDTCTYCKKEPLVLKTEKKYTICILCQDKIINEKIKDLKEIKTITQEIG